MKKTTLSPFKIAALCTLSLLFAVAWYCGAVDASQGPLMLAIAGAATMEDVMKGLDTIEGKLKDFDTKAKGEFETLGKVSTDTKTAIDKLGTDQRELADRLLQIEQKGGQRGGEGGDDKVDTWGQQFIKATGFESFKSGAQRGVRITVKNTVTNAVGNTFSERKPGMVGGSFRNFTLESLLTSLPCSSNAVDYVRENVFTNNAAETAEGAQKPESSITTTPVTEPVATVAHWIKISRQLAMDNAALAAYIDLRMRYGVNLRVENQIINGNGTAPNIAGFTKAGNFTAHGYTAANLTSRFGASYTRLDMLRAIIADCMAGDYPADAILLNPIDWATIETLKDTQGRYLIGNPNDGSEPRVWRKPVVESNAITADTVLVLSLANAATFYNREGVTVDISDSDSDNFTKNLVTLRAERRCMLAVERPAAVRYGDLTPA